jgi:hypothetical protein
MEGDLRGIYGVLEITEGIRTKLPPANRLHLGVGHGVSVRDFGPDGLKYVRELLGHLVNILLRVRYAVSSCVSSAGKKRRRNNRKLNVSPTPVRPNPIPTS